MDLVYLLRAVGRGVHVHPPPPFQDDNNYCSIVMFGEIANFSGSCAFLLHKDCFFFKLPPH